MKLTPFLFLLLALCSCKSQQYTPDTYEKASIVFGDGGGFAGLVKQYCLLDNGQLFLKASRQGEYEQLTQLKRKDTKACFAMLESEAMQGVRYEQPGNIYHYLQLPKGESTQRIVWDPFNMAKLPPEVATLHEALMALVPAGPTGGAER